MHPSEAREALADIQAVDARLATRFGNCPPWRHAVLGGIFAMMIGSVAASGMVQIMTAPLVLLAVFLMVRSDRKRNGMFVNGYRRGATRPLMLIYIGVMMTLVLAALHMRMNGFGVASKIGLSAVAFVLAILFSLVWHRTFRRELTGS